MNALMTGATGFVGSHVAEALRARGDAVVALARRPDSHPMLTAIGATALAGSLEQPGALADAVAAADVVYHIAGLTSGTPADLCHVNEEGTRTMVALCNAAPRPPRLVLLSSMAAAGPSVPGTPQREDTACAPVTEYGRSKLAGEAVVRADTRGPWVILRAPAVYGPRDREFLPVFRMVRWGIAPVFGRGTQQLSMVFVKDLADAVVRAGTTDGVAGRTYNTAHPDVVTSAGVVRAAAAAIGRRPLVVPLPTTVAGPLVRGFAWMVEAAGRRTVVTGDKLNELFAPAWVMATARASADLGFEARWDLARGMRDTAAWYRAEGLL